MKKMKKLSAAARRAYLEELALARISIRLGNALRESGKTQRELAGELGITEARVSQIFAVEGNPTVKTLVRIADGLGCEFDIVVRSRTQELPRALTQSSHSGQPLLCAPLAQAPVLFEERTGWNVVDMHAWRRKRALGPEREGSTEVVGGIA